VGKFFASATQKEDNLDMENLEGSQGGKSSGKAAEWSENLAGTSRGGGWGTRESVSEASGSRLRGAFLATWEPRGNPERISLAGAGYGDKGGKMDKGKVRSRIMGTCYFGG